MAEILHILNWVAAMVTHLHIIIEGKRVLLCPFPNRLKQMVAMRNVDSVRFVCQAPYAESINNSLLFLIQAWNHIQ